MSTVEIYMDKAAAGPSGVFERQKYYRVPAAFAEGLIRAGAAREVLTRTKDDVELAQRRVFRGSVLAVPVKEKAEKAVKVVKKAEKSVPKSESGNEGADAGGGTGADAGGGAGADGGAWPGEEANRALLAKMNKAEVLDELGALGVEADRGLGVEALRALAMEARKKLVLGG